MKKKKKEEKIHLTDHFTYQIMDNVIYLFQSGDYSSEELKVILKKVMLIMEDEEVSYINISAKDIEKNKKVYEDLGFALSYYSVDKLNKLYKGYKNKKEYRCYAFMTKKDFLNIDNEEKTLEEPIIKKDSSSNKGFVSSTVLLFGGMLFMLYLLIEGAIMVLKMGR